MAGDPARVRQVDKTFGWLVYGIVLYGGADAATDGKPIRTSIAFFNRIARSKAMAAWLRSHDGYKEVCDYFQHKGLPVPARDAGITHLDATDRAAERRRQLDRLENCDHNAGITNVGISASASETLRRWSRSRRISPEPPPNSNSGRDIPESDTRGILP